MTWRAALTLPAEAGAQLEQIAKEMGVQPAVAARILLLEKLRERARQEHQERVADPEPLPGTEPSTGA